MKKVTKTTLNINIGILKFFKNITKIFTKEESEEMNSSPEDDEGDREIKKSKYSLVKFILLIIFIGYLVSFHGFRSISEIFEGYGFLVYVVIGVILILGFGAFYSLMRELKKAPKKKEVKQQTQNKEEVSLEETKKVVVSRPGFSWWYFIRTASLILILFIIAATVVAVYDLKNQKPPAISIEAEFEKSYMIKGEDLSSVYIPWDYYSYYVFGCLEVTDGTGKEYTVGGCNQSELSTKTEAWRQIKCRPTDGNSATLIFFTDTLRRAVWFKEHPEYSGKS